MLSRGQRDRPLEAIDRIGLSPLSRCGKAENLAKIPLPVGRHAERTSSNDAPQHHEQLGRLNTRHGKQGQIRIGIVVEE